MTFRAAIWTAVSTERQADKNKDKVSLKTQEDEARAKITAFGWVESAGPFVVDGESRTKWASLYHAEKNIPALRSMIDAAANGQFDVLVLYDFNRFRSLLRQVFDVLNDYGVQMYTVKDGREPVEKYDDKAKNAMSTLIDVHALLSNNQVNSLAMHFADGMPKKVLEQGLHPGIGAIPYGYRKAPGHEYDTKAVYEPTPEAQNLIRMKDLYLSGVSATKIAAMMNEEGIPTAWNRKWSARAVSYALKNVFYAGLVSWGNSKRQRIRRDGSDNVIITTPKVAKGRHQGLWDEATHRRLVWEFRRRGRNIRGSYTKPLSRIMRCWCGEPVVVGTLYVSRKSIPGDYNWTCRTRKSGHFHEKNSTLIHRFIAVLVGVLRNVENAELPAIPDPRPALEAQKKDALRKIQRWMTDYENGKVEAEDYTKRKKELTAQIEDIEDQIYNAESEMNAATNQSATLKSFAETLEFVPEYVINADPAQVNTDLHSFIEAVNIKKGGEIEIKLKS